MEDLFEREKRVLEHAEAYLALAQREGVCAAEEYAALVKAYRALIRQAQQITKIADKTAENLNLSKLDLQDKVRYDELTGVYSRRFLEEGLAKTVETLCQTNGALAVLMIDVDYFKRFNDTYGHCKGDDCLRQIAGAVRDAVGWPDAFAARFGGEEFAVVMPGAREQETCAQARRILEKVTARAIPHAHNDASEWVTVSVGAVSGEVVKGRSPQMFLSVADKALYQSKRSGRNRYTYVDMEDESDDV